MLKTTLQNLYPDALITQVAENTEYSFTINTLYSKKDKVLILFTLGLSLKDRDVNVGFEQYSRTELYFNLPEYWNLTEKEWPIHWLNRIAQIPAKNNTWFGPGDTIPAGNPPAEIEENLKADHFILSPPIEHHADFEKVYAETNISFLSIVPIFQTELRYKIRNSGTVLLNRIKKSGTSDKVDPFRKNVCRKRFLGF